MSFFFLGDRLIGDNYFIIKTRKKCEKYAYLSGTRVSFTLSIKSVINMMIRFQYAINLIQIVNILAALAIHRVLLL